ncbi:hypothetical protein B1B_16913 [mine drainage metagenome]|uniref:MULE transposase, conserved domain protein n=1 Tax=mine drainage metagenome TaxID=410659 RepID=T0YQU8_9ZZZZ
MIAVGLARFGLDLPEKRVRALFEDGCALPLAQSTVSRLSVEFLVRWRMFCEERLPVALRGLEGLVMQFDGTGEPSGGRRVTYRAREARTGLTLGAQPLVSESEGEVTRFYQAFRERYGTPLLGLRDDGAAAKKAMAAVFPGMPVGEDHWHFFDNLGPGILRDYPDLVKGLTGGEGLANLTKWSHTLPVAGWGLETLEKVWVRATLEWIEEARAHPGGFPWALAYLDVVKRLERARAMTVELLSLNRRLNVFVLEVVDLKARVEALLNRESVRGAFSRLGSEVWLWEELRRAARVERERRGREDLAPLSRADVEVVKAAMEAAGERFVQWGDWARPIWVAVAKRLEEHGPYLWAEVPGRGTVIRSTVALERDHGADRRRIRQRTGGRESAMEMDAHGALLAFWANVRCPWFVEHGLKGVNLWEEFARQDPGEVARRMEALPKEGRRPRVELRRGKEEGQLEEFLRVLGGSRATGTGAQRLGGVGGVLPPHRSSHLNDGGWIRETRESVSLR